MYTLTETVRRAITRSCNSLQIRAGLQLSSRHKSSPAGRKSTTGQLHRYLRFTHTWPLTIKSSHRFPSLHTSCVSDHIIIQQHLPGRLGGWKEPQWVKSWLLAFDALFIWAFEGEEQGQAFFLFCCRCHSNDARLLEEPFHRALRCDSEPVSLLQPKTLLYRSSRNLAANYPIHSYIYIYFLLFLNSTNHIILLNNRVKLLIFHPVHNLNSWALQLWLICSSVQKEVMKNEKPMKKTKTKTEIHPFILSRYTIIPDLRVKGNCWSLHQLSQGKSRVTLWTL